MSSDSLGGWNFRGISQNLSGFVAKLFAGLAANLEIW